MSTIALPAVTFLLLDETDLEDIPGELCDLCGIASPRWTMEQHELFFCGGCKRKLEQQDQ